MKNEFIIETLGLFEGYKTRLKELHWSASNMEIHRLIDEYSDTVSKFEDALAEISSSIWGAPEVCSIQPELPEDVEFPDLLQTILGKSIEIKRKCVDEGLIWTGIESTVDSFIADSQIMIYKTKLELGLL